MQCNIEQRGRRARLVTGAIVDAMGALLVVVGALVGPAALIVAGAVASLAGLFMIFEGLKGWCVLRALGIRTKI
jgi:hypothetical protein